MRKVLHQHMPRIFKDFSPRIVLIIDAFEIRAESPLSLDMQSVCYSSYKGTTTMKGLVGLSPTGALGFLSKPCTGSISDKELTKMSDVIDYLHHEMMSWQTKASTYKMTLLQRG